MKEFSPNYIQITSIAQYMLSNLCFVDETQSETKADPAQPLITTADHVWNSTDKTPALTTSVSVEPQSSPRFSGPPRRATSILDSSFRPSSAMDSQMSLDETLAEVLSGGPISGLVSRRATRAVEGQHASRTTFDTDYLIRRSKFISLCLCFKLLNE